MGIRSRHWIIHVDSERDGRGPRVIEACPVVKFPAVGAESFRGYSCVIDDAATGANRGENARAPVVARFEDGFNRFEVASSCVPRATDCYTLAQTLAFIEIGRITVTDENQSVEQEAAAMPEQESTGYAALDKHLSKGTVDFQQGVDKAQVLVSAFVIVALGFLVYSSAFLVPFQGEEIARIQENNALHRVTAFTEALDGSTGPLTVFGFALNWWITPNWAAGFRFFSLLLHLANGVLLYLVARRLLGRGMPEPVPMLAGLLFVVHPLVSEGVVYAVSRGGVQGLFFALLATLCFLDRKETLRPLRVFAAGVFMMLAFGSEPAAVLLPVVLLWADVVRSGFDGARRRIAAHAALFLLLAALVIVRAGSDAGAAPGTASSPARVAALGGYVQHLLSGAAVPLFPDPLGDATVPDNGLAAWCALGALSVASVLLLVLRSVAALAVVWPLAAACAAVCFAPSKHLLADRCAYFAFAGIPLLLPWLITLPRSQSFRAAFGVAAAAIIVASGYMSYERVALWAEPGDLWAGVAERSPHDAMPWRYLGEHALRAAQSSESPDETLGRLAAAEAGFRKALEQEPGNGECLAYLGSVLRYQGRSGEAMQVLKESLRRRPLDGATCVQIGLLYERQARAALGDDFAETAAVLGWTGPMREQIGGMLRGTAWNTELASHLALLYEARARLGKDIEPLRNAAEFLRRARALGVFPGEAVACHAAVSAGIGDSDETLLAFQTLAGPQPKGAVAELLKRYQAMAEKAETLDKAADALLFDQDTLMEGFLRRGEALLFRNEWNRAAYLLETVLEREPGNGAAWSHLGYVRACLGGVEQFSQQHGGDAAASLDAWKDLATRCGAAGNWAAAETYLARADASPDELIRLIALGEIALSLRQVERADAYFRSATEVRPEDPATWLMLCDVALTAKDADRAARWLAEAERRGAWEEEIASRRKTLEELGGTSAAPSEPTRTMIR